MINLSIFLYYTCFASAVIIYGLGLTHTTEINYFSQKSITFIVKVMLSIFITSVLSWLFTQYILKPIGLIELFPIIAMLIYLCINTFLEALIRITTGKSTSEFIFSYLVVLLSIMESTSILNTIIISGSCICSMLLILPLIYAFRKKIYGGDEIYERYFCRLFLFIAVLIFILTAWDIMWINPGAIQ